MIFNVSSVGGAPINYSIRASSSVPAEVGKRNEIVIITETEIGDVQLNCITVPALRGDGSGLQTGDVCISVGTETDMAFNVLKKGTVYGLPNSAFQYSGSEWVEKDAYIYQTNAWKRLFPHFGGTLSSYSWDQIDRIGAAGKADAYFCVGDEKDITLSTGEVITLQIIGFVHDDLSAGNGKAPITFCFKNCMNVGNRMNIAQSNAGGYDGSDLYQTIHGAIYGSLPSDLRAVMKNVNKQTSAGGTSSSIVTTQENLFMLSEIEVFGALNRSKAGEGTQYMFFTNGGARVKTVNGAASCWWERSPLATNSGSFCAVSNTGISSLNLANTEYGVALALCV